MISNIALKILHVEDDPKDAFLLQRSLKKSKSKLYSYELTQVGNMKEALGRLTNDNNFNAVLLDLHLPDGDGVENINLIKNINNNIPIIIITGAKCEKMALEALSEGAQEYIVKTLASGAVIQRIIQSSIFRKRAEIALSKKAYTDSLTELPNRAYFEHTARNMLECAKRNNHQDTLMFIDLNKFKNINDTLGHEAGNTVLKTVAKRLRDTLRTSDVVARYAGDEFVVYMDNGKEFISNNLYKTIAQKIISEVERPIEINGNDLEISLSIGIATYPHAGKTFEELLKNADEAMYKAKSDLGKKYHIINSNGCDSNEGTNNIEQVCSQEKFMVPSSELSDFAHTVAHDLKSPIRKISMFCELLKEEFGNDNAEAAEEYFERIFVSSSRVQVLIDRLLEFSLINNKEEEKRLVSFNELTSIVIQELSVFLQQNNVDIRVEKLPECYVYFAKMKQLITDLIMNAVKYSNSKGKIKILIDSDVKDNLCIINVKDNGMGIEPQQIEKVFVPFHRLHSSDDIEGSGLGLSLCKKIINKHGGEISVESKVGVGSTFRVSLPARD